MNIVATLYLSISSERFRDRYCILYFVEDHFTQRSKRGVKEHRMVEMKDVVENKRLEGLNAGIEGGYSVPESQFSQRGEGDRLTRVDLDENRRLIEAEGGFNNRASVPLNNSRSPFVAGR